MNKLLLTIIVATLAMPTAAFAGRSCEEREITPATLQKASDVALKTYNYLQATDAQMAFVARVGSDLSDYKLKYSHMGIALRDHPKGSWYFVHELNQCGKSTSDIYDEGMVNFYLDDPFTYDTMIAIPSQELQQNIVEFLKHGGAKKVHNEKYSMISNPFNAKYQNSNGFILSTIIAAQNMDNLTEPNPRTIAAHLQNTEYKPTTIRVGFFKRIGGSIFKANVAFDDHKGKGVNFVSVKSIIDYLRKTDKDLLTKEI